MKSIGVERVTVTLPADVVQEIDRREENRSRFVAEAVRRELSRLGRTELERSLRKPHPEAAGPADSEGLTLESWGLPNEDVTALVDASAARPVRWVPGEGWEAEESE